MFGFCALPNSINNFKSYNYRSVFVCHCSLRSCFVVFPGRADLTAVFLHWSRVGFPQTISGYSAIAARTASSQVRMGDTIGKGFCREIILKQRHLAMICLWISSKVVKSVACQTWYGKMPDFQAEIDEK